MYNCDAGTSYHWKITAQCFFKTSRTTHPMTHCHITTETNHKFRIFILLSYVFIDRHCSTEGYLFVIVACLGFVVKPHTLKAIAVYDSVATALKIYRVRLQVNIPTHKKLGRTTNYIMNSRVREFPQ